MHEDFDLLSDKKLSTIFILSFLDCISFDLFISQNEQMSKPSKESVKYGKYNFKGFT